MSRMPKVPTIADLQKEIYTLKEQHKVHAEVLITQNEQPAWQATLGKYISRLSDLIFYVQYAPWAWLMIHCLSIEQERADGTYSPRKAAANIAMIFSGAVNAFGVFLYVHFVAKHDDLLAFGTGYVAWFSAILLLHTAKERARLRAGNRWEASANRFSATLFRSFGVKVKQVTGSATAFPLFQLVGFLPALVVGFLTNWVNEARYETLCAEGWTLASSPEVQTYNEFTGIGCKMKDMRYDYFTFVAFLTGNVIAGYQVVKFGATCLLAHGEASGEVDGGAGTIAAAEKHTESALEAGFSASHRTRASSGEGITMRTTAASALASQDAVAETADATVSSV